MSRIIFTNANLLDGNHPARAATLVIEGERIRDISVGSVETGPEDVVIDLQGKTVMPGMVQAHFHAAYWQAGNSGKPLGLEVHPSQTALRAAANFQTALQCGFTGTIGAGCPHAIDAAMKLAIAEGAQVGPRIMAGSRDISSTGHSGDMSYPSWMQIGAAGGVHIADGPEEIRRVVRLEAKNGAEIVKLFATRGHGTGGSGSEWDLAPEEIEMAVRTASARGIKARAHAANRDAILLCLNSGVHIIDHGDGFDEVCQERILDKGAFLVPSLWYPKRMMTIAPGIPYTEAMKPDYEAMARLLPELNKAGVKLLIGDDYGAQGVDHGTYAEELILYVEELGIPALDVIRWATRHGAEAMGLGDQTGTVEVGKLADLLVINGDPSIDIKLLRDRSNLCAIMLGGKFVKNDINTRTAITRGP